jgi:tricorn protease-like protein
MIKSVTIDFRIEKSITIVSGEDFKIKRVATFYNSTDIIISNISKDKVQQLRELYKSNKEIKITNLPVGDIVIVVDNKQLFQTIIKHAL